MKMKSKEKEKGTTSFTIDPIKIYLEDHAGCFDDKNIVLVLDRKLLSIRGVEPAIYIPQEEIYNYLYDYRYADESAIGEGEWRSTEPINIEDSLRYVLFIPQREYQLKTNTFNFS